MGAKRRNECGKTQGPLHHVESTRLSKSASTSTSHLDLGHTVLPDTNHVTLGYSVPHTATIVCRSRLDFCNTFGVESGGMWGPQRD
jgi:hypothetical protein